MIAAADRKFSAATFTSHTQAMEGEKDCCSYNTAVALYMYTKQNKISTFAIML
jgi:hypothetical protein